jgi:hypothetical protein
MADAETVQWVSVTTTRDALGNTETAEADPVDVPALVAARGSGSETFDQRAPGVIVGETLYILDPAVVPGASDWFTIRGVRYDVEGEGFRWGSSGSEVAVRRSANQP